MPTIYVVNLEEFLPVVQGCRKAGYTVQGPHAGYWSIHADTVIQLHRKQLGLGPALWYTCLAGGIEGQVTDFGRETLTIVERA
jgi:hypothetical protein